jgi:hypothetical protein
MVETSAVQIVINVTDANSGAATAAVESNLNKIGAAGSRSGAQAKKGFEELGAGALSAREKTRLLTEEMGVRIPRALQTVIANSAMARNALNALGGAMIAFGAIQIGGMMFTALLAGMEKVWDHYHGLQKVAEDYNAELEKTRLQEFGNTRDIETTTFRIQQASEAAREFARQADAAQRETTGWWLALNLVAPGAGSIAQSWSSQGKANDLAKQAWDQAAIVAKMKEVTRVEQEHEMNLLHIRADHPKDQLGEKLAENEENRQFGIKRQRAYGNTVPNDAGMERKNLEDQIARQDALKEKKSAGARSEKSDIQELARLHEEAYEAGLRGSALYEAKEAWAIKELELRGITSAAAVDDVHKRFHEEQIKRLEQQTQETERMERQAALGGLTGVARTQAEGANRVADIRGEDIDPALKARRIAAAESETDREVTEEKKHSADELAEKHQRAEEETERIEADSRIKFQNSEKEKTLAIQTELQERLAKYRDELNAQDISQDDFNRRSIAAEERANAEMIEASTEARKKMAGEFDSLFKGLEHPGRYFEEQGNKALGEMAARLTQRIQQRHGGAGSAEPEAQGSLAGIVGQVFGAKKPGAADSTHSVAQGAFSVASAIIHVGSASIVGGGGFGGGSGGSGGGSGAGGGGWSSSGGSTGLFSMAPGVSSGPGETSSPQSFSVGSAGAVPPPNGLLDRAGAVANTASQGYSFAKQMASMFAGGKGKTGMASDAGDSAQVTHDPLAGKLNADGSFTSAGSGSGMMANIKAGGAQGMIGAAGAGLSLFQTSQGKGGGIMAGAESGAQIGMEFGGPIGAGIGAAIGVALGIKGDREKARVYDLQQVRPKLASDRDAYQQGGMDYTTAYSDAQQMIGTSWAATKAMGKVAEMYWGSNIKPEIEQAMAKLTAEERAGRSQYTAQAASYAVGTDYVPGTGMAMLHAGERVVPSDQNERITQAVEGAGRMPVQAASMGDVHLHVHAIDAKGVAAFLGQYKHNIRAAVNDSYAENSGGGMS